MLWWLWFKWYGGGGITPPPPPVTAPPYSPPVWNSFNNVDKVPWTPRKYYKNFR